MNTIEISNVTKRFGGVTALDGVDLSVEPNTTFGLLGTNGAGKTTLFRLLVGHLEPDAGSVRVAGRDVASAGRAVRSEIGYLPEQAGFPGKLTGREVLAYHARMRGLDPGERIETTLDRVGLAAAADRPVEGYSKGMNRRLGLATALLARPDVLLLDEPTSGLDPLGIADLHRIVRELRTESDLTVVLSSHVMAEVETLCDEAALLHDGKVIAEGTMAELVGRFGGTVTVRIWLHREEESETAVRIGRRHGGEVAASMRDRIDFDCSMHAAPDLLSTLAETVELEGYEVVEPGLTRVFEDVVREGGSA